MTAASFALQQGDTSSGLLVSAYFLSNMAFAHTFMIS